MGKQIFYGDDARRRLIGGAQMLYEAVKVTYGPKGGNVVIRTPGGAPTVTHDGVTVAESIVINDRNDETLGYFDGAELIKSAAQNLNRLAGDGTTTVTILTYQILKHANRLIVAGENPQTLRSELEEARDIVLAELKRLAAEISAESEEVFQIASISAGDKKIGRIIADVMKEVGVDGTVTVEASNGLELRSEIVKGYTLDRGFTSPFFITDQARQETVYANADILITDKKLKNIMEILPFIEKIGQAGKKDLVIIADSVEGEVLNTLVINKAKGIFNTVSIKPPAYGDRRLDVLQDIATLTGGTVVSDSKGHKFEEIGIEVLGSADKVIVGKDQTTIVGGRGAQEDVIARIEQIKANHKREDYEKEFADQRMAALAGKVAIIQVGGSSETEIEEKKFRVDDAVAAAKAALAEGIVAGGGVTLVHLSDGLDASIPGHKLLKLALLEPFKVLMDNANLSADSELSRVLKADPGMGVDVMHSTDAELIDLKKAGVIDPVRVTREAIDNAVSIAGTAATMGSLVVESPDE